MLLCIELVCAVLVCIINKSISEEFKFKVVAPKYICNVQNTSQTTIRENLTSINITSLVGEDVPKLEYNLSVGFKFLNLNAYKQRNVLMVWRSVRNLEKAIKNMTTDDLNRGIMSINNTMLTPDIKYEFNITAKEKNKTTIDQRQFSFEVLSKTNEKSTMSASLTGPHVTYADINYIAQAEILSCTDNSDYKLSWQLLDSAKKIVREESTKSRTLRLPPHSLTSGQRYSLKCLVYDNKTSQNKTSSVLRIKVLQRGMQLNTYIKHLKIGPNQPIYLNAYFSDPDCIKAELTFEWKCIDSGTNEVCAPFESTNSTELVLPEGFPTAGSYLFTVKAIKDTTSVSATSQVAVVEEMLPVIDVENAITTCNPQDSLQISAHVSQLIIGCTLQWTSVTDNPEYSDIDLTLAPGEPGKLFEITEDEEELEELAEHNNTIDKQHDFILPVPNESWKGLNSSSKYLFRLIVSCPCSENNSSDNGSAVTSSVDVEVVTNSSPVMKNLNVNPTSGEALRTIYTYSTELPTNCSNPLSYKFGYVNDKQKNVYVIQQYDTSNAETILPFNADPIQTILAVCDSRNACNSTLGPKVTVSLPVNFTEAEILSFINRFNKSISEQDYFSAFTLASILLKTSSQMVPNKTFVAFNANIKNITTNELDSMLKTTDDSWRQPAGSLLKNIKILADEIHLPDEILDAILSLRDRLSEKQNGHRKKVEKRQTRKLLSLVTDKKSKRIINGINMDEIKDYLEISELAIKRLKDYERVEQEKEKLRKKLQNYIPQICQFLYKNYKTDVRIELTTFILAVEKINLVRKYNEFLFVPYEINSAGKILLGRDIADRHKRQNGVCIGKIFFVEDYFHIPQYVYNIDLYTATGEEHLNTDDMENYGIIMEMPVKSTVSNDQNLQCVLWEDSQWNFNKCKTLEESKDKVKCACKSLGYFSIVPIERTTTVTVSTLKTTTKVLLQNTVRANAVVTNELSHVTQPQPPTNQSGKYRIDEKHSNTGEKSIKSAAIWSITIMSVGIFSLLVAFLMLFKRLKRTDVIQNFQTIEYAKYFDEQNME